MIRPEAGLHREASRPGRDQRTEVGELAIRAAGPQTGQDCDRSWAGRDPDRHTRAELDDLLGREPGDPIEAVSARTAETACAASPAASDEVRDVQVQTHQKTPLQRRNACVVLMKRVRSAGCSSHLTAPPPPAPPDSVASAGCASSPAVTWRVVPR